MNNFNHNISKLILQYINYTTDNLKKNFGNKTRDTGYVINPNLTCLDIIVKCLRIGYEGFYMSNSYVNSLKYIKSTINDKRIKIYINDINTYFYIDNIHENEKSCKDIFSLDNVVLIKNMKDQ
jgi:cellulase/cellobiase CelA1